MSAAPRGVSRTALLMAALRIEEGERADPLVDDPLAQAFIAAAGGGDTPTAAVLPAGASAFLALRTRLLHHAAPAGGAPRGPPGGPLAAGPSPPALPPGRPP